MTRMRDDRVQALVGRVGRRMALARFLRALVRLSAVSAGVCLTLAVAEKLTATAMPWTGILIGAAVVSFGGAAVWAWMRRPGRIAIAQRIDERAGLEDAIGSALALEEASAGGWSDLVREDAERRAWGVNAGAVEPIGTPRGVVMMSGLSLAAVLAWMFVPTVDLLGKQEEQRAQEEERRAIERTRREIAQSRDELDRAIRQLDESFGVESRAFDAELPESVRDAEELRRARVRQLTALSDRLDEAARGPGAKKAERLEEMLRKLRRPGAGPMDEVATNLARAELDQTGESIEELRRRVGSGEVSEREREQMGEQAQDLADQLDELARRGAAGAQEKIERVLGEAGMDPERIDTVSKDERAIEELKGSQELTEPQLQSIEDAQAERFAAEQMEEMSEALRELGEQMEDAPRGERVPIDRSLQELARSLGESQQLQEQMKQLAGAMQMTEQQLSQMGMSGREGERADARAERGETGGTPRAGGQQPGTEGEPGEGWSEGEFALRQERSAVKDGEGPIIASSLVDGPQVRGESRARFAEAVRSAEQAAGDAIESRAIPSDRRAIIAHYFGSLKKPTEKKD